MLLTFISILGAYLVTTILNVLLYTNIEALKAADNLHDAVSLRHEIKMKRFIFLGGIFILYSLVLYALATLYLNSSWGENQDRFRVYISIMPQALVFLWRAVRDNEEDNVLRPISTKCKEDVIESKDGFVLYLRGFETDNYSIKLQLDKDNSMNFSEYKLVKYLSERIRVYAVGMTKECYSPNGADRIYLDDTTWRDDVKKLMAAADKIVVLINDKQNCIWEIQQCKALLYKTIFIADNIVVYNRAKNKILGESFLPKVDGSIAERPFYFYKDDSDNFVIKSLTNHKELSYIINNDPEMSQPLIIGLWIGLLFSCFPYLYSAIAFYGMISHGIYEEMPLLLGVLIGSSIMTYAFWKMLHIEKIGVIIFCTVLIISMLLSLILGDGIHGLIIPLLVFIIYAALMCFKENNISGYKAFGLFK